MASSDASWWAAIPGVGGMVGALLVWLKSNREINAANRRDYVTLTKEASDLLLARIDEIKADAKFNDARCLRNIAKLRQALIDAEIPVPELEW